MQVYSAIGAIQVPVSEIASLQGVSRALAPFYVLRSGAADGCDKAFEQGAKSADGVCDIILPWRGYSGHSSLKVPSTANVKKAKELAAPWVSGMSQRSPSVQALIASGAFHVLGIDLTSPVDFVVCWTADGCNHYSKITRNTGGTGVGIALASQRGIPVFNLRNASDWFALADHTGIAEWQLRGSDQLPLI